MIKKSQFLFSTSQSLKNQANSKVLRLGMWHIDGLDNPYSASSSFSSQQRQQRSALQPKLSPHERKALISKFLSSVAGSVDAFVILGAGTTTTSLLFKDPSEICDTDKVYDCIARGTSGSSFGENFVFVPKPEVRRRIDGGRRASSSDGSSSDISGAAGEDFEFDPTVNGYWNAESVPGAGGLNVRFTFASTSNMTQKGRDGSGEAEAEADEGILIRSSFDSVLKHDQKSTASSTQSSSSSSTFPLPTKRKANFVNCCFVDLSKVSQTYCGARGHNQQTILGYSNPSTVLALDGDLSIIRRQQQQEQNEPLRNKDDTTKKTNMKFDHDTNELRLARYLTNVATGTDIIAGHARTFDFDLEHLRLKNGGGSQPVGQQQQQEQSEQDEAKLTRTWYDAWFVNGKEEKCRLTFDAHLNATKYYRRHGQSGDHFRHLVGGSRRSDKFLFRASSGIRCSDFKTVRNSVSYFSECGHAASCYLPLIGEFSVPSRWLY